MPQRDAFVESYAQRHKQVSNRIEQKFSAKMEAVEQQARSIQQELHNLQQALQTRIHQIDADLQAAIAGIAPAPAQQFEQTLFASLRKAGISPP